MGRALRATVDHRHGSVRIAIDQQTYSELRGGGPPATALQDESADFAGLHCRRTSRRVAVVSRWQLRRRVVDLRGGCDALGGASPADVVVEIHSSIGDLRGRTRSGGIVENQGVDPGAAIVETIRDLARQHHGETLGRPGRTANRDDHLPRRILHQVGESVMLPYRHVRGDGDLLRDDDQLLTGRVIGRRCAGGGGWHGHHHDGHEGGDWGGNTPSPATIIHVPVLPLRGQSCGKLQNTALRLTHIRLGPPGPRIRGEKDTVSYSNIMLNSFYLYVNSPIVENFKLC